MAFWLTFTAWKDPWCFFLRGSPLSLVALMPATRDVGSSLLSCFSFFYVSHPGRLVSSAIWSDPLALVGSRLCLLSSQNNFWREGFIWLSHSTHSPLLRESRTGTQGRNLWAGTKAEAEEEHVYWVFLGSRSACFFFLPGTSCPRVVHPTELDPSTSIINQDVPQMWQLARPIKTVPQLMVPLPRYF